MFKKVMLFTFGMLLLGLTVISQWSGGAVVKASEATVFTSPLPPNPVADFYNNPYDPSIYDNITFTDISYDPQGQGFQAWTWDFGDGAKATTPYVSHMYKKDGDYKVRHTVKTVDGRTGSVTRLLVVRTRDIAITKFARPKDGRVGDQRQFTIGISSKIQAETVHVELYKSVVGSYDGFQQIGYSEQYVPVQKNGKTTDFLFSYTFTPDDAKIGKVNFKAVAWIVNGRDAFPADNAYITLPVKVTARKGVSGVGVQEVDSEEVVDDVMNGDAIAVPLAENIQSYRSYMPLVQK